MDNNFKRDLFLRIYFTTYTPVQGFNLRESKIHYETLVKDSFFLSLCNPEATPSQPKEDPAPKTNVWARNGLPKYKVLSVDKLNNNHQEDYYFYTENEAKDYVYWYDCKAISFTYIGPV